MIKLTRIFAILIIMLLSKLVYATTCTQLKSKVRYDISMGRVVVPPNLANGQVIAEKTISIAESYQHLRCKNNAAMAGESTTLVLPSLSSKIYNTNLPGVGISFERSIDNGDTNIFPYYYNVKVGSGASAVDIGIAASKFTVKLYKIDNNVTAGELDRGITYAYFGHPTLPLFEVHMAKGTTIVAPSCQVENPNDNKVYLRTIKRSDLTGKGSTAGETEFPIRLKCSGSSLPTAKVNKVNLTFDGNIPSNMSKKEGVLINELENQNSNAAKGVGIQVLDGKKPVEFGKKYFVGALSDAVNVGYLDLKYIARYYQYGDQISTGKVESKMVFNLTYD